MAKAFVFGVKVSGARETLAAIRKLPKDTVKELRVASKELAGKLAEKAAEAGRAEGSQAAVVARTVRAGLDKVPVVQAGGAKRIGSRRAPAWTLLFGSEFGSDQYTQFPRSHQGRQGIWFFPTVEENSAEIAREWRQAADRVIAAFNAGPGVTDGG